MNEQDLVVYGGRAFRVARKDSDHYLLVDLEGSLENVRVGVDDLLLSPALDRYADRDNDVWFRVAGTFDKYALLDGSGGQLSLDEILRFYGPLRPGDAACPGDIVRIRPEEEFKVESEPVAGRVMVSSRSDSSDRFWVRLDQVESKRGAPSAGDVYVMDAGTTAIVTSVSGGSVVLHSPKGRLLYEVEGFQDAASGWRKVDTGV